MKSLVERMFVTSIRDDYTKWTLDAVAYESWTVIGKRWMAKAKASTPGDAMYNLWRFRLTRRAS
jgi:hypothetical protein